MIFLLVSVGFYVSGPVSVGVWSLVAMVMILDLAVMMMMMMFMVIAVLVTCQYYF